MNAAMSEAKGRGDGPGGDDGSVPELLGWSQELRFSVRRLRSCEGGDVLSGLRFLLSICSREVCKFPIRDDLGVGGTDRAASIEVLWSDTISLLPSSPRRVPNPDR